MTLRCLDYLGYRSGLAIVCGALFFLWQVLRWLCAVRDTRSITFLKKRNLNVVVIRNLYTYNRESKVVPMQIDDVTIRVLLSSKSLINSVWLAQSN